MPIKVSIAIVQSVLNHYRVPLFDALVERLKSDNVDLKVL